MQMRNDRTLTEGQIVKIYYNLHKHCLSIVDKKTNRVIGYTDTILLEEACFKVSEKGRQRVLRERRKNVHACIEGKYRNETSDISLEGFRAAYYHPYETEKFIDIKTGKPLVRASEVACFGKKVFYHV